MTARAAHAQTHGYRRTWIDRLQGGVADLEEMLLENGHV